MRQLTLFNAEPTPFIRLVSWLLQHANTAPPVSRFRFYRMKDDILRRYGRLDAVKLCDWQDCSLTCNSCDGTGGLWEPGGCYKCEGSGIYRHVYVPLARWWIGGRMFHLPGDSTSRRPEEIDIHGRVYHVPSQHAKKAALALAILFDRDYARLLAKTMPPFSWPGRLRRKWWNLKFYVADRHYRWRRGIVDDEEVPF